MREELRSLEPKFVWKYFNEVRKIPRCSTHEETAHAIHSRIKYNHAFLESSQFV